MKNKLKDFFNYSSSERKGSIALILLLLIVLSSYWFIDFFVHSSDREFESLSEQIKSLTKIDNNLNNEVKEIQYFNFNPNQIDQESWMLLGFSEKQAQSIIKVQADDDVIALRQNFESLIEIFIKVKNMNGLFLRLVEIFDSLGVEIIDADIATTKDKKIALNTFVASYKYKSIKLTQNDIKDLSSKIHAIFDGTKIIKRIVHNKNGNSHFKNPTKITESVDEENKRNILTIETINSSGLLVKIAEIFIPSFDCRWNFASSSHK